MNDIKSFGKNDFDIIKHDILYQGVFRLSEYTLRHRLFAGEWSNHFTREVFERKPAVAILPYDPILDRVILIEQFRAGCVSDPESPWLIELPAGIIDKNLSPEETAHKEMQEETGCKLLELKPLYQYFVSPGASNEFIYIFYGRVDSSGVNGIHGLQEEGEDIRVLNLTREEAFRLIEQGKIKNAPTLIGLMWLQLQKSK